MKQSVKYIQRLVGTEHLPRTAQVVDQGIQLLQVFSFAASRTACISFSVSVINFSSMTASLP